MVATCQTILLKRNLLHGNHYFAASFVLQNEKTVQKQLHKRKKEINDAKKNYIKRNLIFVWVSICIKWWCFVLGNYLFH